MNGKNRQMFPYPGEPKIIRGKPRCHEWNSVQIRTATRCLFFPKRGTRMRRCSLTWPQLTAQQRSEP